MKNKLQRCRLPLLVSTGILPLTAVLAWGNGLPLLALWTAAYLLAACICMQLPGKIRLGTAVGFALGMAVLGAAGLIRMDAPLFLLMGILHGALLLAALPNRENIRQAVVYSGLLLHAGVQIFLNLTNGTPIRETYASMQPLLTADLVAFLALSLLTLNSISLSSALPETQAVPGSIRRKNKLVILLMLIAALLIAWIPAWSQFLTRIWNGLQRAVKWLIRRLLSLFPGETASSGGRGAADFSLGSLTEETAAGNFALWMEKILLGLAAAVTIVLLLLALRILWKKLKIFLNWLFRRLQNYVGSATEEYTDELENTRTEGEKHFSPGRHYRHRIPRREEEALPSRERIRRRYAIARARHPEWPQSHTARQTLNEESARIYERARYSSHPITEEDVRHFKP